MRLHCRPSISFCEHALYFSGFWQCTWILDLTTWIIACICGIYHGMEDDPSKGEEHLSLKVKLKPARCMHAWRAHQRVVETAKLLCIPFFLKTSKDIFFPLPFFSWARFLSSPSFFSAFCHAVHTFAQIHQHEWQVGATQYNVPLFSSEDRWNKSQYHKHRHCLDFQTTRSHAHLSAP